MAQEDLLWNEAVTKEDPKEVLKRLIKIVDSKTGIVRALIEQARRNDERKLFSYAAWLCNTSLFSEVNVQRFGGGVSINRETAMLKALGEAIERYCLSVYKLKDFPLFSYNEINEQALDPRKVVSFSDQQLSSDRFMRFRFNKNTKFRWVMGYSLTRHKPIYVPAQLVYFYHVEEEPIIRFPDSNGAASWPSLAGAVRQGICEVVERDAIMINYLNKLPRERVEIENIQNDTIVELRRIHEKYEFELYVYDLTTDIPISTMLSILIDRSGVGPAVVVGTASNLDPYTAIISSIEGAKAGPELRDAVLRNPNLDPTKIRNPNLAHGLFWWGSDKIAHLDFFLKNRRRKEIGLLKDRSAYDVVRDLKDILRIFEEKRIEVVFVDVTTPDIRDLGFSVVKAVMPELHPIHQLERFKYFGGKRLYQVPRILGYKDRAPREDEFNQIPHPFI
jgi:ribosomal protein S12 methylthiotransferase accessory factor